MLNSNDSPDPWKEFLAGPLEDRALCRLDAKPSLVRQTRATLNHGAAHPDHRRE